MRLRTLLYLVCIILTPSASSQICFNGCVAELGQLMYIGANVTNSADVNIPPTKIAFYDGKPSKKSLIGFDVISFPALSKQLATVNWTPTTLGEHMIYVVIDPDNTLVESDEDNNMAARSIYVILGNETVGQNETAVRRNETEVNKTGGGGRGGDGDSGVQSGGGGGSGGGSSGGGNSGGGPGGSVIPPTTTNCPPTPQHMSCPTGVMCPFESQSCIRWRCDLCPQPPTFLEEYGLYIIIISLLILLVLIIRW